MHLHPFASWSPRQRLAAGGLVFAVLAAGAVSAIVLAGSGAAPKAADIRQATPTHSSPSPTSPHSETQSTNPPPPTILAPLTRTDDPAAYAREVAMTLFAVSPEQITRAQFLQFWRGELPTTVYSDAAAKGLTLDAQNADVIDNLTSGWIPPQDSWNAEAADDTTNRFTVTSISVPDYWVNAVADGTFRDPGLHMERVMGVQTQSYGTNPANRHTASRPVVIDIGLLCGPTQPGGCRLVAPQQPPSLGQS